jgi:Universal stress protein UspA and related nucleotide-binding proteins
MFQHILVPLDGSPRAEQALPVAAQLARASGGTLVLLHIVDVAYTYGSYRGMQPMLLQDAIDSSLRSANEYFDRLSHHNALAGVSFKTKIIQGYPAGAILTTIETHAIDLVVMCSHGYTGVQRWLLGSVAEKIVHHAPVPILILRNEQPLKIRQRPDNTIFIRVLVPLDASPRAQDAIAPAAAVAAALSSPGQGEIHLEQIVVFPESLGKQDREALLRYARQNLQEISNCFREGLIANVEPDLHVSLTWSISVDSDIAEGITRIAENGEKTPEGEIEASDLIAMTTHGYTGIQKWTMGSIANRVLHATRLPLLLVRPADMLKKEQQEKEGQKVQ